MSWLLLAAAIALEVMGTTCMKLSQGFTRLVPSILVFVFYMCSLTSLTLALRKIDISIAYAIWAGVGTALIALIGIVWFQEAASVQKVLSIGLIIIGVVGLNLQTPHAEVPPAANAPAPQVE